MNIRPYGLARRWQPFSLLFKTQLCHGSDCYSHHVGGVIFLFLFLILDLFILRGLTSLLSEHSSDQVGLGDGSHSPYCKTQLYHDRSNIVANKFVGSLSVK